MNLTKIWTTIHQILSYKVPIHPHIIHPGITIVLGLVWMFMICDTLVQDNERYQRIAYVTAIDQYRTYDIVTIDTLSSQYQQETTSNKYKKGQRIYVPNYDTELIDMLAREHCDLLWQFVLGYLVVCACCAYICYRHDVQQYKQYKQYK